MGSGISYLYDKRWAEITRDERFFCAELFRVLRLPGQLERLLTDLNSALPKREGKEGLPMTGWDIAFEAVFYRDLLHYRRNPVGKSVFSRKRTFDLALFHDEHIVVIEAKALQGLSKDQVESFILDKRQIEMLLGKATPNVHLVLLCSNEYAGSMRSAPIRAAFDAVITWHRMAEIYRKVDGDAGQAFERADALRAKPK